MESPFGCFSGSGEGKRPLMPTGLSPPVKSIVNTAQFEVRNPYHSQGLAAGGSALLDAINRGKVHLAKFILDAGESDVVNTRDFKGKTPLIRACYIKEEKTRGKAINLLLEKSADVNIQDEFGRTALSYACELRCNDVVKHLVKNNVDPDIPDKKGNTPLIYSAMIGNDTAIEILIKSFRRLGLQVDHVNDEGLTALLIAAKDGFVECASMLALEGKACISFRDRERGLNAEEWAREQGCSTPEVLPFSAQAALLNYKKLDTDRTSPGGQDASGDSGEDLESMLGKHHKVKNGQGKDRGSGLDIDELSKRLVQLNSDDSVKLYPPEAEALGSSRSRRKRSSLPAIKFHGTFSMLPERGHSDKGAKQKDKKQSNSTLSTDESHNSKSSQKRKISFGNRNQDKMSANMPTKLERETSRSPTSDDNTRRKSTTSTLTSVSKVEVDLLANDLPAKQLKSPKSKTPKSPKSPRSPKSPKSPKP